MVKCPPGTIKNPDTQKCVLVDGRVGKRILLERKLKRSASRKSPRGNKKCPPGTILNPDTQNCVLVDGKIGKRILLEKKLKRSTPRKSSRSNKKCPPGTILNPDTLKCVLVDGRVGKRILLERKLKRSASRKSPRGNKKCPPGTILNPDTQNCVLVDGKVGKRILLERKLKRSASRLPHVSTSSTTSLFGLQSSSSGSSGSRILTSSLQSSSGSSGSRILTSSLQSSLGSSPSPEPNGPLKVRFNFDRVPPPGDTTFLRSPSPEPSVPRLPLRVPPTTTFLRSPSPEPRMPSVPLRVPFDRLPPALIRVRSPSPFTRSDSPSRLPTRIEPKYVMQSPTIHEEPSEEYNFPAGPGISKKLSFSSIKEDCNYLKQWDQGIETGSGEVGTTKMITHKNYNYSYILKSQKKNNSNYLSQFTAELNALIELQGTNLVPKIYAAWTCRTKGFIIMEKLYSCDNLNPQVLYTKIADKLKKIEAAGWLHVDTHDGNVMCTADGEPVIIDFGYAVKRKRAGDTATYPEHPKSQPKAKGGWGVPLPWKFLAVMQEVNFHESFNPYGSRNKRIKKQATKQNEIDYKKMQKNYKEAQIQLRYENGYRGIVELDQLSYHSRNLNK